MHNNSVSDDAESVTKRIEEADEEYYFEDINSCPCNRAFDGNVWDALGSKDAVAEWKTDIKGEVDKTAVLTGEVSIGRGSTIGPYVVIEGPVVIGKDSHVRSGALIRKGTVIGDNCVVGHGSEIKNSIIFNKAKIASFVFVGDSIIGKGARLGSGTILGNRRFDQKEILIKIKGNIYSTKKDKFGAVIGDYCRLGADCITEPGAVMGKYTWIYGGCTVRGFVPKESLVKMRQSVEIVPKERVLLNSRDKDGDV